MVEVDQQPPVESINVEIVARTIVVSVELSDMLQVQATGALEERLPIAELEWW